MSDSSSSDMENIPTKELLKRLNKLKRKIKKAKRRHRTRSRSRSKSSRHSRSCSRPRDYRSPSGSGFRRHNRFRSYTRSRSPEERDYRSPGGSGSQNENTDRVLHDSASVKSLDNHNPCDMVALADDPGVTEQANTANVPGPCEDSPVLQIHNSEELPEDILEILGVDPDCDNQVTFNIHPALGSRWGHIVQHGVPSSDLVKLLDKYALPSNCSALTPPMLNPEIKNALSSALAKRDQSYFEGQTQLCKGISALAKGIGEIISESENIPHEKKTRLLGYFGDSGRILCDLVCKNTQTRRAIITPTLNKPIKEVVDKIPSTEFLFGANLGESIKNAKEMERASKQLKPDPANYSASFKSFKKPAVKRGGGARVDLPSKSPMAHLNRTRPARNQREPRPRGHPQRETQYGRRR